MQLQKVLYDKPNDFPAGYYTPAVDFGCYIMLSPMRPGKTPDPDGSQLERLGLRCNLLHHRSQIAVLLKKTKTRSPRPVLLVFAIPHSCFSDP